MLFARLNLGKGEGSIHRAHQPLTGYAVEPGHVLLEVLGHLGKDLRAPRDGDDLLVRPVKQVIAQDAGVQDVGIGEDDTDQVDLAGGVAHPVRPRSFCRAARSASACRRRGRSASRNARIEETRTRWCVPTLRNSSRPRSISLRTWGRDMPISTAASVGVTSAFPGDITISSPRARASTNRDTNSAVSRDSDTFTSSP